MTEKHRETEATEKKKKTVPRTSLSPQEEKRCHHKVSQRALVISWCF
jgi:hypothetical protein